MYVFGERSVATVHALDWPEIETGLQDPTLEREIEVVRSVEEAAATARQQAGRKRRWPIRRLVVASDDEGVLEAVDRRSALLADRVNAKEIQTVEPPWEELEAIARPRMDRIGPAFGEQAGAIRAHVDGLALQAVTGGIEIDGEQFDLDEDMIEVERQPPAEVSGADFEGGSVYVDASLTPSIEAEGYAREVIRRIQEMRKELDLEIDTPIRTTIDTEDEAVASYLDEWESHIATETRTASFDGEVEGLLEEWEIEGISVRIGIEPNET